MALKYKCKKCGKYTIPKRIKGVYIGSNDIIKIWECHLCHNLWRN